MTLVALADLIPNPANPRTHKIAQVRALARSIETFGFNAPILVDKRNQIVAGHGRWEAAKLLNLSAVTVIRLEHLTEHQARAYMLADNKLAEGSSWDEGKLAIHLKELSELALDFDLEATGFELPEIDLHIQFLDPPDVADRDDTFFLPAGAPVSRPGDLWLLGEHRLFCGSALESTILAAQETGRVCRAIEIDAGYCDVAIRRWEKFTKAEAVLDGDGRTFANIAAERAAGGDGAAPLGNAAAPASNRRPTDFRDGVGERRFLRNEATATTRKGLSK